MVPSAGLPVRSADDLLSEAGEFAALFLVPVQVEGQQVTERAQCLLLEHQLFRPDQMIGYDGLKLLQKHEKMENIFTQEAAERSYGRLLRNKL